VHNKIEHEKHLLRTVVLIKVLVDTRATGCITQQLSYYIDFFVSRLFVYISVYRCVVISYVGRCCVWMEIYHLILPPSILYIVYVG
jgi:hypothetical protein